MCSVVVTLEDARAYGKQIVTPVDKNLLDLEQLFATYTAGLGAGTFKARVGRQQMAFDLQRFIAYATQPVQDRDAATFDDTSNGTITFSGLRFERQSIGPGDLSGYWSRYNRCHARFIDAAGDEHRDVWDLRYPGRKADSIGTSRRCYRRGR